MFSPLYRFPSTAKYPPHWNATIIDICAAVMNCYECEKNEEE